MALLIALLGLALLGASDAVGAGQPGLQEDAIAIEEVVVIGRRPGPPLWKIAHGDHVLWLFGLVDPIPEELQWDEASLAHLFSEADVLLLAPSVSASVSNPLRLVGLLRKLRRVQRLPRRSTLADVIPSELAVSLDQVLRRMNLSPRPYRRLRPMHAAQAMRERALQRVGLGSSDRIEKTIRRMARRQGVRVVQPTLEHDPAAALSALDAVPDNEQILCLQVTVAALARDTQAAIDRAQAWADGDAQALAALDYPDPLSACGAGLFDSTTLQPVIAEAEQRWLDAAASALAMHKVTIAVLPVRELVSKRGLRVRLEERLR